MIELGKIHPALTELMALPIIGLDMPPHPDPDRSAVLQFTSGSTGEPKGIELSLRMIETNCRALAGALGIHRNARIYNWMPFYHDFGLIFGLFLPIFFECRVCQVDPLVFLQDPVSCFMGLEKNSITHTAFASFALGHAVANIDQKLLGDLDLSSLQKMLVGADVILPQNVEDFRDFFSPFGLQQDVLVGGYGLAEATLAVTVGRNGVQSRVLADTSWQDAFPCAEVVDCGEPIEGVTIKVRPLNSDQAAIKEGQVGEILVAGPAVIDSYAGQDSGSERVQFEGFSCIATGDIGFLEDGILFVCGRIKEFALNNCFID